MSLEAAGNKALKAAIEAERLLPIDSCRGDAEDVTSALHAVSKLEGAQINDSPHRVELVRIARNGGGEGGIGRLSAGEDVHSYSIIHTTHAQS